MRYLAIIFLLVLSDQSLACQMDMDWVWAHDINLAGLQADCSTYETRNYRVMEGFLRIARLFLLAVCWALSVSVWHPLSFARKERQRSIRALIRISPMRLFDLIWLSSFVTTVWFFVIWLGDRMNGPALSYSAMFTLLGFPVLRVILVYVMARMQVTRSKNPWGG